MTHLNNTHVFELNDTFISTFLLGPLDILVLLMGTLLGFCC